MPKDKGYSERFYRKWVHSDDLVTQEIVVKETDVFISAEKDVKDMAEKVIGKYRRQIEDYVRLNPEFKRSLEPLDDDPKAADIIKDMLCASRLAGVGPMASVAGAIAEFSGKELVPYAGQIIVENGGDIFIDCQRDRIVSVFAGPSPLTNKLFLKIDVKDMPLGICTSSGTVGHSLSFGKADACVIISKSASLADAAATAACNRVNTKDDIKLALEFACSIKGVQGALIIYDKDFGVSGNIELV